MTLHRCLGCKRTWDSPSGDEEIQDFCSVCMEQSIDGLIKEIEKREDDEKDKRMRGYWSKNKILE